MRHASDGSEDLDATASIGDGAVPGRRMLTDRLPVQLRGLEGRPGPAPAASDAWASVQDDPFGMHLAGGASR